MNKKVPAISMVTLLSTSMLLGLVANMIKAQEITQKN